MLKMDKMTFAFVNHQQDVTSYAVRHNYYFTTMLSVVMARKKFNTTTRMKSKCKWNLLLIGIFLMICHCARSF
jgi:hypothetical protein